MLDENRTVPANEAIGHVVMLLGVLLPATVYWQSGGLEFLGAHTLPKLVAATAGCGAFALALYNGPLGWQRAILPGALAGAGASTLQMGYVHLLCLLGREYVSSSEIVFVSFFGSVPGLLLYGFVRWRLR